MRFSWSPQGNKRALTMHPISIKLILLFIFFVELPWIDVHLVIATICFIHGW